MRKPLIYKNSTISNRSEYFTGYSSSCLLFSISVLIMFQRRPLVTETSTTFIAVTFFSFLIIESHPGFLAPLTLVTGSKACLSFPTLDLTDQPCPCTSGCGGFSSSDRSCWLIFPCSGAQGINQLPEVPGRKEMTSYIIKVCSFGTGPFPSSAVPSEKQQQKPNYDRPTSGLSESRLPACAAGIRCSIRMGPWTWQAVEGGRADLDRRSPKQ